ncbi:uncharacterized protein CTRU02_214041 [Colletotrichum truncatum]|uniref:Uncharacterized protein n=1 Tax=Colletotrichum truncatum TaxID=5467 RepID=A0ACC3YHG0_COLTU|nr:uncharacterized protein CTRU02_06352 [Colletotrichum truncatum]KAF6792856.1 hypothetical protein CTRU02_06352 [Colletotrichum truncatum]
MKTAVTGLVFLASIAFALPGKNTVYYRSAEDVNDDNLPVAELSFTGPVTVGGPNVTLHGTADAIYQQILELNPAYDPWAFPEYAEGLTSRGFTKNDLTQRSPNSPIEGSLVSRQSNYDCSYGNWINGYYSQCAVALNQLLLLGSSTCSAPKGACARVSCSSSCSMYLCNTHTDKVDVQCWDIAGDMGTIVLRCGSDNGNGDTRARGRKVFDNHYVALSQQAC